MCSYDLFELDIKEGIVKPSIGMYTKYDLYPY